MAKQAGRRTEDVVGAGRVRVVVVGVCLLLGAPAMRAQRSSEPETLYRESRPAMGTVFTIECYATDRDRAEQIADLAFDEIDRLEASLSNYRPGSELSRISRDAQWGPVATDPETFEFLSRSMEWSARSRGAFDITVGALLRTWGFKARQGHVPTPAEQREVRSEVGWEKVRLVRRERTVRFTNGRPMELDPGSIGKGYAVDRVVALLRESGVRTAFVSAGESTVYGMGAPQGGRGWPVEIPDPRWPGRFATTVWLRDASLSTGACTERFFVQGGHRYCHIFDPRTLMPVEGVLQSTVIAPSATDSDALSTVVFVLPPGQSRDIVRGQRDTEAIVFRSRGDGPTCVATGDLARACDAGDDREREAAMHQARKDADR